MSEKPVPLVCVIVVNWNGVRFLPRCLQSLRDQTAHGVQVILVDNGSDDESVSLTKRDFPEIEVLELEQNYGYAEANNRAAALTRASYLLFLNNDTYLDPGALDALVSAAEAQPSHVAIFAPQQRSFDGTESWHVGMGLDILGYPRRGKTFYADGAALFIRRNAFHALGGFDPHYFMFYEETDLCWRAWVWGYRVASVPEAIVFHKAGGTAGSSIAGNQQYVTSKRKRRLAHRNQLMTLLKNYSTPTLCAVLPLVALATAVEVSLLALTGQHDAISAAYVPAWQDLLRDRHYVRMVRQRIQASRAVSDLAVIRHMEWKLGTLNVLRRSGIPKVS